MTPYHTNVSNIFRRTKCYFETHNCHNFDIFLVMLFICLVDENVLLKPWLNGRASRRKFGKPELACGLVMGGQTDSQVGSQKAVNFTHILMTCDQLVSTCVGWPHFEKSASTCV